MLGYLPNRHGVEWFINSAWPRVRAASPRRRLVVAGAAPAGAPLRLEGEGISAPGYVDNLEKLYAEAAVFVAPLFCGGGTRIKLLEAAAHAVPIVATTVAARGLPFVDPESAWIADRPEAFARACLEALANPVEVGSAGGRGPRAGV